MSQASDDYQTPVQQSAAQKKDETFLVRIVSLDYYMAKPLPGLDVCFSPVEGTAIERVPVVQVYGSTPGGQKTCVHLHKAFPYFYVPYDNDFPQEPLQAQAFVRHFARALESAMHAGLESGAQRHQRVLAVQLVRATPYYGYHPDETLFMKIIMYNPTDVGRAAKLLQAGGVVGKSLQPYEAHVPFLLQLKIDLNLAGMGWLYLSQINCRVPFPDRFMHRRKGWRDTPTLIQYESDAPPGSGPSISEGTLAASQQDKLWVVETLPMQWTLPIQTAAGPGRMLEKRSCCELEADACVEHVLNRGELVRDKLEDVGPDKRMVESLAPMWDEERQRCGGTGPPSPPSDPERDPQPLCPTVDFIRAQFQDKAKCRYALLQAIADAHAAELAEAEPEQAATPAAQPHPVGPHETPAVRPSGTSTASTSASQRELLQQTQAANRVIPAEGSPGHDVPDGTYNGELPFVPPGQVLPGMELQAEDIVQREDLDTAMEQDPAGERPAVAFQEGHEDEERHLRQLMELLHQEDSCSDEEVDRQARLMALAAQVATQHGPSQPVSQFDVLDKHLERAASQAEQECQAILSAAGASRPPSGTGTPEPKHASMAPRKLQRMHEAAREGEEYPEQELVLEDIEALGGDIPAPMGPQQGSNATWDGGGGPPGVAAFSLRNQLGVFEGYSDDDDFNWSLISSREPQLDPPNPSSGPPPDERHLPQVDGAGDDSSSADAVPDSASERDDDRECEHFNEADSQGRPGKRAETGPALGAGRQPVSSAGSQQTNSSSQRFGGLALQKASPSTHSAPAGLHAAGDTAAAQGGTRGAQRSRSAASMAPARRKRPPRTVGPLRLDASTHTGSSRQSSGLLPGQYRPPTKLDAERARAAFRPPRPAVESTGLSGATAQHSLAGAMLQQPASGSIPARGLGQYSTDVLKEGLHLSFSSQPAVHQDPANPSQHAPDQAVGGELSTGAEPSEGLGHQEPSLPVFQAGHTGDAGAVNRLPSAGQQAAVGQLRAPGMPMRARRRPQLGAPAEQSSQPAAAGLSSIPDAEGQQQAALVTSPAPAAPEHQVGYRAAHAADNLLQEALSPPESQQSGSGLNGSHQAERPAQSHGSERGRRQSQEFVARIAKETAWLRSMLTDSTSSSEHRHEAHEDEQPVSPLMEQQSMPDAAARNQRHALHEAHPGSMHMEQPCMSGAAGSPLQPEEEPDIVVDLSSPSPAKQERAAESPAPSQPALMALDSPAAVLPGHSQSPAIPLHSPDGDPAAELPAPSQPIADGSLMHVSEFQQSLPQEQQQSAPAGREPESPSRDSNGIDSKEGPHHVASPVRLSLNLDLTASSKQTPPGISAQDQHSVPASPEGLAGMQPEAPHSALGCRPKPSMHAGDLAAVDVQIGHRSGMARMQEERPTPGSVQHEAPDAEGLQLSDVPLSALHPRGLFQSQPVQRSPACALILVPQGISQAQPHSVAAMHEDIEEQGPPGSQAHLQHMSRGNSQDAPDRYSDRSGPAVTPHQTHAQSSPILDNTHPTQDRDVSKQPPGASKRVTQDLVAAEDGSQQDPSMDPASRLHAFRPRSRPPTREELQSSMAEQGVPDIVHQGVFYGNPADVPERPIVWAGLEFKIGSTATSSLPPFRSGTRTSGPSAMEAWKAKAAQQHQGSAVPKAPRRLYAFTPAILPPTWAETEEWLAQEKKAAEGSQKSSSSRSKARTPGSAAHRPQVGVAFGMDANTGRLLPGQHGPSSQESGGSDLLETPALATLPSQGRPGPGPSRLRMATQQSSGDEQPEEEEIRPASPKYDERSFFYTTPRLNPAWPSLQRPVASRMPPNVAPSAELTEVVPCTLKTPAAAVPPSPNWAERNEVLATPETPMGQVRPLMPPPLFSAGQADLQGTSALSAIQQLSHSVHGPPGDAKTPQDLQATAKELLGAPVNPPPGNTTKRWTSQITPPSPTVRGQSTPVSQAGFRRLVPGKGQNLTLLSIELHADTRGTLLPDPRYDAVRCIVLAAADDAEDMSDGNYTARVLLFDDKSKVLRDGLPNVQMEAFESENALLDAFVEAVRALDPDILVGFEVQQGSLGYLVERASTLERSDPLLRQLSRTPQVASSVERRNDDYGQLHASGLHCHGRIVLNLWRLLRSELKLRIYTFESCVAAVLQLRTPHTPAWVLAQWFAQGPAGGRWRCVQYWVRRARLSLAMMEQLDMTGRTGELARAFGIDFFSVLTRGSQYRVEAMMVRLAHTQNYLLPAPSKLQCTGQPAMEAIPLVMEPESRLYVDPVIVLDFQSLYPSQIIAYNLCYSTCLGRPAHATAGSEAPIRLGAQTYGQPRGVMKDGLAPEKLIIAPNGVAYAPPEARPGILPRLLREILSTRIMVKAAMKRAPKSAKVLQRILNARQFGLKLIANVTYGYTAAGFSGRMPCAELADSIVQSGRETLENAIRMVEGNPKWRARVVYGDTDSLFVLLPGRSREEAFQIGAEIAAAATAANPPPVTLKMEKVYHPCVLLAKKRYVGFMYESPGQAAPTFDAKGIETVRRDTCGAVAKMMERTLRILFTSKDLSQVKDYVQRQWTKILAGRVSLADFVFAKEVRLGTYSARHGIIPPAAIVASRAMASDPRMEPRYGERVPYMVVYGEPGARLIDMVVSPHALIESQGRLRLHANYYITKQIIPALERVISLVGADMRVWFATMPRPQRLLPQKRPAAALGLGGGRSSAGTIDAYYLSRHCAVCDGLTHAQRPLCDACRAEPQAAAAILGARSMRLSGAHTLLVKVCLHCGGGGGRLQAGDGIGCDSLDCGLFFERKKAAGEAAAAEALCQAALALF